MKFIWVHVALSLEITDAFCYGCHSIGTLVNPILPVFGIVRKITGVPEKSFHF